MVGDSIGALAQPPVLPPGPGPLLTSAKAIDDLQKARVISPGSARSADQSISAQDFAQLVMRTVGIDVRKTLKLATTTQESPALAARAVKELNFSANAKSFVDPASPITREDAVLTAMNAAASKGLLRVGAIPSKYPPFADDAAFATPRGRKLAHRAVFQGLIRVGPDNLFNPQKPLKYDDAAYLLDAIRLASRGPEEE